MRPPLKWYGGKHYLASWIISHFPEHRIYLEPFGGGASVLLNKPPVEVETYNDIDLRLTRFFRVLRDSSDDFLERVRLYLARCEMNCSCPWDRILVHHGRFALERRARLWFMDEWRSRMAWFRVRLSKEEERIVGEERREHPHEPTRRKMETLWLLHHGLTREKVAKIVGVGLSTVQRYANAFRDGGLDGLRRWEKKGRTGLLEAHRKLLAESFRERPASSVAEAADRIEQLTGIRRGPSQTRLFLKKLGMRWQRMAAIPVPPKKVSRNTWLSSSGFSLTN